MARVYLPVAIGPKASRKVDLGQSGAFYVGFSQRTADWEPALLRGVRRNEIAHLEERGRALIDGPLFTAAGE